MRKPRLRLFKMKSSKRILVVKCISIPDAMGHILMRGDIDDEELRELENSITFVRYDSGIPPIGVIFDSLRLSKSAKLSKD